MLEIEDGGGLLEQASARDNGYHPTLESSTINKKGSRVSTRYITIMEIRVYIHNSLHPSIVQVENHLTVAYRWYHEF